MHTSLLYNPLSIIEVVKLYNYRKAVHKNCTNLTMILSNKCYIFIFNKIGSRKSAHFTVPGYTFGTRLSAMT
ncbi:hypothetical protein MRY16398_02830 [Phytobacter sp. MRY16-398]|nr:hypothetical protein MRY16398_02830 [Phytobacter sp. MRY16-398]